MGLTSRLFLLLVSCVTIQQAVAWPYFNIWKWTDVEYDVNRVADDVIKDIRKDLLNAKNKIWRDTSKMISKKRLDESAITCILQKQSEQLENLDEMSIEAIQCIENVRTEVKDIQSEARPELIMLKNQYKSQVKGCGNESKNVFKTSQKTFQINAVSCLRAPGMAL